MSLLTFLIIVIATQLIVIIGVFLTQEEGVVSYAGYICIVSGVLANFLILGLYFFYRHGRIFFI